MKICFIADASSLHTFKWIRFFSNKGHEIKIISLKKPVFDYGDKVEVFWIKKLIPVPSLLSHVINIFPVLFQIAVLKKKIKADVYHALGTSNGWLAALVGFKPLIYTIADPGILDIPYQRKLPLTYKLLDKFSIKKSDLLVCDGENVKEALLKLGADNKKIRIIRYGVDIDKFKPLREIFKKNIVLSVKPLRKECNVETLLRAVPEVSKKVDSVEFLILGNGEEKNNLIKLSEKLNIDRYVKFLGWVDPEELPEYFNKAKIFVGTSLVETGLASTTAEAMACGTPIIVTDSGDNKLSIKDGENGFIFSPMDHDELARKLIILLQDKDLWDKFYLSHRKWIEDNNNYDREMKKMEKIYEHFIENKKDN